MGASWSRSTGVRRSAANKMSVMSGSRARRSLLLIALALPALWLATAARAEEGPPRAATAAAWYPSGVGVVAEPTYPAGSLHVGSAVDQETDRTYLRFELDVPDDADVDTVTVTVPIDPAAGTSSPEAATILACAVPGGFDPAAAAPAEVDCDDAPQATVTADAVVVSVPATGTTVDLALVPGGGTWHVGFDGPDGDAPPTAAASYDVATPPATTTTVAARPTPAPAPTSAAPSSGGPFALPSLTPPPSAPGAIIADQADLATPGAVATSSVSGSAGFRYAAVFALPLVLLVLIAVIGNGLTTPIRLREDAA